ncbi:MAG: hypothetical protein K9L56_14210 [Clostridiales bacterium]|nr:hypothetical protein [Clostridiales bacterium]
MDEQLSMSFYDFGWEYLIDHQAKRNYAIDKTIENKKILEQNREDRRILEWQ